MSDKIVLVIEDQKSMALLLQQSLSQICDLPILIAHSLSEAQQVIDSGQQILVCLSDLHLPDAMHGEVVGMLQKHHITTVVLTANYSEQTRQEMFKAHVADYVIKDGKASIDYAVNTVVKLVNNALKMVWVLASPNGYTNKLVGLLKIHRYPVRVFEDCKSLQKSLQKKLPDILLMEDVNNIRGAEIFSFVSRLRSEYSVNQLPIMVCGGGEDLPSAIKLMKYGVNDFYHVDSSAEEFYVRLNQNLEQAEAYQKIERISQTDALTQLYNRGYFFETASKRLDEWQKQQTPFFVVMADIDHFKKVNDTHGHQKGDEAIVFVANQLKQVFKPYLVARFGGEEYCVIGELSSAEQILALCESFRQVVEQKALAETGVAFTVSVGLNFGGVDLENAIFLADEALYAAKENGRNQVVNRSIQTKNECFSA